MLGELVDLVHGTPLVQPPLWGRAVGFKGATPQDGATVGLLTKGSFYLEIFKEIQNLCVQKGQLLGFIGNTVPKLNRTKILTVKSNLCRMFIGHFNVKKG